MGLKNIIIVNDFNYVQGGASDVAINTTQAIDKTKYNVVFFSRTGKKNSLENIEDICMEETECLTDPNKIRGFFKYIYNKKTYKEFSKVLSQYSNEDTIVHVHGWTKSLSSSIFKACEDKKIKYVVTFHDYFMACPNGGFFNYKNNKKCKYKPLSLKCICCNCDSRSYIHKILRILRQTKQNTIFKKLKYGIYISDFSLSVLKKFLPKDIKLFKVTNPINTKNEKKIEKIENNKYFLYVGRVSKEKGVEDFCKAITELELEGIVVGDGSELDKLKNKYQNIKFEGWKDKKEVISYMLKARALIFPTLWYEGSPLTTVEAMSVGLPCIISGENAAGEFVNSENGMIYECGNIEDLKDKIIKYNNSDIKEYSKNCINTYNDITKKVYAEEIIKVYENIMK